MIRPLTVLRIARGLRSERGENPEYDRALVEMTGDLLGIAHDLARDLVLGEGTISQ